MKIRSGTGVMAIAVLHEVIGLVEGWSLTLDIVRDGVVNSLGQDWERNTLFWFHVCGIALFVIGDMMNSLERVTGEVAPRHALMLLGFGVFGVVFIPISGFWLVGAWGLFLLVRARLARAQLSASGTAGSSK